MFQVILARAVAAPLLLVLGTPGEGHLPTSSTATVLYKPRSDTIKCLNPKKVVRTKDAVILPKLFLTK